MKSKKWVIDTSIIEEDVLLQFREIFKKLHIDYEEVKYKPFSQTNEKIRFEPQDRGFMYCSVGYAKNAIKRGYRDWVICNFDNMKVSSYISVLPNLLNEESIIWHWSTFKDYYDKIFEMFNVNCLFIKPNDGDKVFTGMSVHKNNVKQFIDFINTRLKNEKYSGDLIVALSKSKSILAEYRFIVINGKVITGSQYRTNLDFETSSIYPIEAKKIADQVANSEWEQKK
jgi:hypothetical protein